MTYSIEILERVKDVCDIFVFGEVRFAHTLSFHHTSTEAWGHHPILDWINCGIYMKSLSFSRRDWMIGKESIYQEPFDVYGCCFT